MKRQKENWAEKFKKTILRYPLIIIVALFITLISQIIILSQGIEKVNALYKQTLGWKREEEKIINTLSASVDIGIFKKRLGDPLFVKTKDSFTEYSFYRRGYWVQAITDSSGSVGVFAITLCDDTFHPSITYNPAGNKAVILGKTYLNQVVDDADDAILANYFISGATANSYLTEQVYLGNPSNYQTVFWGVNDICLFDEYVSKEAFDYLLDQKYDQDYDINNPQIKKLRSTTKINTFGISAPLLQGSLIPENFQLGVDRVLIRTIQKPMY